MSKEFKEIEALKSIKKMIEEGNLTEAECIIKEHLKYNKETPETIFIKSVLYYLKGNLDLAINEIDRGLMMDDENYELLYTKAMIFEQLGKHEQAKYYYSKAKIFDMDKITYKNYEGKRVLIGSPIRQRKPILEEFLQSLSQLDTIGLYVDYLFIDDNIDAECSFLLNNFRPDKTTIIRFENDDNYVCDENTHYWDKKLIKKVASYKNYIIRYAIDKDYDYLFLIDSDLYLHKFTLKKLISNNLDIVSNIFWTKWTPNGRLEPQVWVEDQYNFFKKEDVRGDWKKQVTLEQAFLEMLKKEGVYEVGGLCACTLISKNALLKGVSFSNLGNLSFWGEDRHFCIRAKSLGFKLYVDTNYPAFHIYRESDLEELKKFKDNKCKYVFKKNILLVYTNNSGSNTKALYKFIPNEIKQKYNVNLVKQEMTLQYARAVSEADILVITEGNVLLSKNELKKKQIIIDLWHGFPIKAMGILDKTDGDAQRISGIWRNIDYICSYSDLFNTLMRRCIGEQKTEFVVTGAPRNDMLLKSDSKHNLEKVFNINCKGKIVCFYMPTFRESIFKGINEGNKNLNNIFGFRSFDEKRFENWIKENNILFIAKFHPAEEKIIINRIKVPDEVKLLTDDMLENYDLDLYELLGAADFIITDYSSVYFDALLLDKKNIFIPIDINEYNEKRGFLLDYYEWTPGPKVYDQNELEKEFEIYLSKDDYYREERRKVKEKVHKYIDANSSLRVWEFLNKIISDI